MDLVDSMMACEANQCPCTSSQWLNIMFINLTLWTRRDIVTGWFVVVVVVVGQSHF